MPNRIYNSFTCSREIHAANVRWLIMNTKTVDIIIIIVWIEKISLEHRHSGNWMSRFVHFRLSTKMRKINTSNSNPMKSVNGAKQLRNKQPILMTPYHSRWFTNNQNETVLNQQRLQFNYANNLLTAFAFKSHSWTDSNNLYIFLEFWTKKIDFSS